MPKSGTLKAWDMRRNRTLATMRFLHVLGLMLNHPAGAVARGLHGRASALFVQAPGLWKPHTFVDRASPASSARAKPVLPLGPLAPARQMPLKSIWRRMSGKGSPLRVEDVLLECQTEIGVNLDLEEEIEAIVGSVQWSAGQSIGGGKKIGRFQLQAPYEVRIEKFHLWH